MRLDADISGGLWISQENSLASQRSGEYEYLLNNRSRPGVAGSGGLY
jgi:hypothetical protein